jgi:RNA polymerase-binding transcription factor DksA
VKAQSKVQPKKQSAPTKAQATHTRGQAAPSKTPARAQVTKTTAKAQAAKTPTKTQATKTQATKTQTAKAQPAKAQPTRAGADPKAAASKAPATKAPTAKAPAAKAAATNATATKAHEPKSGLQKAPARPVGKPKGDRAAFFEKQRQLLLEERDQYLRSAEALKAQADSLALEHEPGDVQFDEEGGEGGTSNIDREMDLVLSAQARSAAAEIDRALEKIEAGTYGYCEQCGQPIPEARLQALPYAALCVSCKSGGLSARR